MRAGEELGDEVAEMLMLLRIKRANGNFGRGPGNADCGEPYRVQYEALPGGPGEKPCRVHRAGSVIVYHRESLS